MELKRSYPLSDSPIHHSTRPRIPKDEYRHIRKCLSKENISISRLERYAKRQEKLLKQYPQLNRVQARLIELGLTSVAKTPIFTRLCRHHSPPSHLTELSKLYQRLILVESIEQIKSIKELANSILNPSDFPEVAACASPRVDLKKMADAEERSDQWLSKILMGLTMMIKKHEKNTTAEKISQNQMRPF